MSELRISSNWLNQMKVRPVWGRMLRGRRITAEGEIALWSLVHDRSTSRVTVAAGGLWLGRRKNGDMTRTGERKERGDWIEG